MKSRVSVLAMAAVLSIGTMAWGANEAPPSKADTPPSPPQAQKSVTQGSVTIEGKRIDYTATAGTIILKDREGKPTGSMFYVAYVRRGVKNENHRPVTFFYNGGPGSSTIWLHMGAFGPWRVVTSDHTHTPAAPYQLVNNDYSLLDVTDEVFIDAMSTGYSRIIRKDQGGVGTTKDFYGVDPDIRSFAQFITRYLSENDRWNSPKYLYGESYGTVRSEILANVLEQRKDVDLNGVVLQSSYTGFMASPDTRAETNLPTYAAVAWYHHKLPNEPADLPAFLAQVEHFAMNDYATGLNAGNTLSTDQFDAIAQKLHDYTGLSVAYIEKANLRITEGEFLHELLHDQDLTVGQLDARFTGPSMDPMSRESEYDPQAAAISSAYVAGFNKYAHNVLKYGRNQHYRPEAYQIIHPWPRQHVDILTGQPMFGMNAGVDLAQAMKYDPNLQVEVDEGYFDMDLPYYGMIYSINHLKLPKSLQSHIQVKYYDSGHMIYVHVPGLKKLHDNTADFIRSTENPS